MNIFKPVLRNENAHFLKRWLAFCVDLIFSNMVRILLIQLFFLIKGKEFLISFLQDFIKYYPDFELSNIKDFHIRYITENIIFSNLTILIFIMLFAGCFYNLLCFIFLKNGTLGQKVLSLKVIKNNENKDDMNIFQKIARSILQPLPYILLIILILGVFFKNLGFPQHMIRNNFIQQFDYYIMVISTFNVIAYYALFIVFVWVNVYFFSNRFFLHDIITKTRVVDKKALIMESVDYDASSFTFVKFIKKCLPFIEKINILLKNLVAKSILYIKNKFNKGKK